MTKGSSSLLVLACRPLSRRNLAIFSDQREGDGEMSANALLSVFTIEIGGTPTLTFEAQNLRGRPPGNDDVGGTQQDVSRRRLHPNT
jgi:hypothetical protein